MPRQKKDGNRPTETRTRELPLVALRETVIFPEMIVPLQVGREKSVNALNAAVAEGSMIALVTQRRAEMEEIGDPAELYSIGTLAKIAQVVQAMVKEAGFDVKIQSTEFATSLDMADKGQFEAYVLAWSGRADPDGNLYSFDFCKAPLDYAGYCKPEVDDLLNRSRTASDPAERRKIYEQIAAIVLKDRPIVYLFHRHWLWAHTAKLTGLRTIPDGLVRVQGLKMN